MGVRVRPAPWWLTWVVIGGLLALFLGERVLASTIIPRLIFSLAGGGALVGATGWRLWSWRAATGEARQVERLLLWSYIGVVAAVIGFVVSSEGGMGVLGIAFEERDAERRYEIMLQVLSALVLAGSILPALGAQWALAAHRHAGASALEVESLRVRETATGGFTVALAGGFLFLAAYTASERDKTLDLSYFKTSSPGTATMEVVRNLGEPVRVLAFFPAVNEVKDEVVGYFRQLADATGAVTLEEYDRLVAPDVARDQQVTADGTIVIRRGERSERLTIPVEIRSARAQLRSLDRRVHERVLRLARQIRIAYFSVGHEEINDAAATDPPGRSDDPLRSVKALEEILQLLNYRVQPLGLQHGLGSEVPDDAGVVLVIGPKRPFLPEELDALTRYARRGGALLLALDAGTAFQLGPLEPELGVRFRSELLLDDRQHLRRQGNLSDRQFIITDRFTAHEAVTTLSRTRVGAGILLVGAGHLESLDASELKRSFVVRSLPSTFVDLNGNFEFDADREERRSYNLVAAIETVPPKPDTAAAAALAITGGSSDLAARDQGKAADGPPRMRALVYADAEMFTDAVLTSIGLNAALVADGIRWLGGEEAFSGATESEEDVRIVHTKAEDVAWFYSTILGAPMVVVSIGLVTVFRRRRKRGNAT